MGLLILSLYVVGFALLAYGLSLVYGPLGFVTVGLGLLSGAFVQIRTLRR